jgi:hypothetical protein
MGASEKYFSLQVLLLVKEQGLKKLCNVCAIPSLMAIIISSMEN